jgi:hypothetical protein
MTKNTIKVTFSGIMEEEVVLTDEVVGFARIDDNHAILSLKDNVAQNVSRIIGYQNMKQLNFFESSTSEYKFVTSIEKSGNIHGNIKENLKLEGCFISSIELDALHAINNEHVYITVKLTYDSLIEL